MPCADTSSILKVRLDAEDRLLDFEFAKITCNKEIGGHTGYRQYCAGRDGDEIARLEFEEILTILAIENPDEQFLLYLEWESVRTALALYRGRIGAGEAARYRIDSIAHDEDGGVTLSLAGSPPERMPRIKPCCSRPHPPA